MTIPPQTDSVDQPQTPLSTGVAIPTPAHPSTQAMPQTFQAQPVMYQPQPASPSNGIAMTAMILGIVGAFVGFWAIIPITGYFSSAFGFPLALAAVICGHIGRGRSKRINGVGRIQALVGFLLGYLAIAVMVIASAAWTLFLFVGAV